MYLISALHWRTELSLLPGPVHKGIWGIKCYFCLYRECASSAGFSLVATSPCSSPNFHQQLQPHNPGYLVPAWTTLILVLGPLAVFYPQDTSRDLLLPFAVADLKCHLRGRDLESPTRLRTRILQSSCSVRLHPHTRVRLCRLLVFQLQTHIFPKPQIPHTSPRPPSAAETWSWWPPCPTRHWVQTKQRHNIGYSGFMECCWFENKSNSLLFLWWALPQMWDLKNKATALNKYALRCKTQAPSWDL